MSPIDRRTFVRRLSASTAAAFATAADGAPVGRAASSLSRATPKRVAPARTVSDTVSDPWAP